MTTGPQTQGAPPRKTRVLVVDDSVVMRMTLSRLLEQVPGVEVVDAAGDVATAAARVVELRPDVMTLDVEMPGMDGLAFLERLMKTRPMPVVMVSSYTRPGRDATLRALELGAVDFVAKPSAPDGGDTETFARQLGESVVGAAQARARAGALKAARGASRCQGDGGLSEVIIAIGASTGGPCALSYLIGELPADGPAVVIAQHMPVTFTASFASRLDSIGDVRVSLASHGDRLLRGRVLVTPGDHHARVARHGSGFRVELQPCAPRERLKPCVDHLFESCAAEAKERATGVLLTGMGADGARGLLAMRRAGARTIAQDATTSVVFGMPRAAIEIGAAMRVLPLDAIAGEIKAHATLAGAGRSIRHEGGR